VPEVAITVMGYIPGVVPGFPPLPPPPLPLLPPQAPVSPAIAKISSAANTQRSRVRRPRVATTSPAGSAASSVPQAITTSGGASTGGHCRRPRGATSDGAAVMNDTVTCVFPMVPSAAGNVGGLGTNPGAVLEKLHDESFGSPEQENATLAGKGALWAGIIVSGVATATPRGVEEEPVVGHAMPAVAPTQRLKSLVIVKVIVFERPPTGSDTCTFTGPTVEKSFAFSVTVICVELCNDGVCGTPLNNTVEFDVKPPPVNASNRLVVVTGAAFGPREANRRGATLESCKSQAPRPCVPARRIRAAG